MTKHINTDELNSKLCCLNCRHRKKNSLYCLHLGMDIDSRDFCSHLMYQERNDVPNYSEISEEIE